MTVPINALLMAEAIGRVLRKRDPTISQQDQQRFCDEFFDFLNRASKLLLNVEPTTARRAAMLFLVRQLELETANEIKEFVDDFEAAFRS
jgi:hypothetical protein